MKKLLTLALGLVLTVSLAACSKTPAKNPSQSSSEIASVVSSETTSEAKYVEFYLEGLLEKVEVETVNGSVGNYEISINTDEFVLQKTETVDIFTRKDKSLLEADFCISKYSEADPDEFISNMKKQFNADYEFCSATKDIKIGKYNATEVLFQGNLRDKQYCKTCFLVDCGKEQFLIEAHYTMEMFEGLYVQMVAYFNTFTYLG